MKTYHFESLIAALILVISTMLLTTGRVEDWLTMLGVFFLFQYVSIGNRLEERHASQENPEVACVRWMSRYMYIKEAFFVASFIVIGLYPPLVGSAIFMIYPAWRKLWRKWYPLNRNK